MNRIGERAIKFFKFTPIVILISCIFFTTALHTQEAHADTGKKAELEEWISTVKGNNQMGNFCKATQSFYTSSTGLFIGDDKTKMYLTRYFSDGASIGGNLDADSMALALDECMDYYAEADTLMACDSISAKETVEKGKKIVNDKGNWRVLNNNELKLIGESSLLITCNKSTADDKRIEAEISSLKSICKGDSSCEKAIDSSYKTCVDSDKERKNSSSVANCLRKNSALKSIEKKDLEKAVESAYTEGKEAWQAKRDEEIKKSCRPNAGMYWDEEAHECKKQEDVESISNCKITAIGWLICPVAYAMASAADGIYGLLIEPMLHAPNVSGNDALKESWSWIRNLANVIFIIMFLFIIYSQLTSIGLSNYGIKRMLPRLVLFAIFINTSYIICSAAIELSNLIGVSLHTFLSSIFESSKSIPSWEAVVGALLGSKASIGVAIAAMIAIEGVGTAMMWAIIPLLLTALIAVVVAWIVLALRQGLIIILLAVSPIAIAMSILPNTQKIYEKWKDLFLSMLMLFPLMSLLFGGSKIASNAIMAASNSAEGNIIWAGTLVLIALVLQTLPLIIAPFLVKSSGSMVGKIGGKFGGMLESSLGKPVSKFANRRRDMGLGLMKDRTLAKMTSYANKNHDSTESLIGNRNFKGLMRKGIGKVVARGYMRDAKKESLSNAIQANRSEFMANNEKALDLSNEAKAQSTRARNEDYKRAQEYATAISTDDSLAELAGGTRQNGADIARNAANTELMKEFNSQVEMFESGYSTRESEDLEAIYKDDSRTMEERVAAVRAISERGPKNMHNLIDYLGNNHNNPEVRNLQTYAASSIGKSKAKPSTIKGADTDAMKTGRFESNTLISAIDKLREGKISGESLSKMGGTDIKSINRAMQILDDVESGAFNRANYFDGSYFKKDDGSPHTDRIESARALASYVRNMTPAEKAAYRASLSNLETSMYDYVASNPNYAGSMDVGVEQTYNEIFGRIR